MKNAYEPPVAEAIKLEPDAEVLTDVDGGLGTTSNPTPQQQDL